MPKRITIKDLARMANVSTATVSYTLNNTPGKNISEETRERILQLAKKMDYIPNVSAKQLKTRQAKCIAVRLSHTLLMPRYYTILQGIRSYLEPRGYSILLCSNADGDSLAGCIDACLSGQADGLIYISTTGRGIQPQDRETLDRWHIPFSVIDCMGSDPTVSSILYDYFASTRSRMEVLLSRGFQKYIYIRPAYQNYKEEQREWGARSVQLSRPDVSVEVVPLEYLDDGWRKRTKYNEEDRAHFKAGYLPQLKALLDRADRGTAIVSYGREVQDAITQLLFQQHLQDGTAATENWSERSVSYHFPHENCGQEAARSLLNHINGDPQVRKLSLQPILELVDPKSF